MVDSRIPALGPRGEGWVAGQLVLLVGIAASGALALDHVVVNPVHVLLAGAGVVLIAGGGWASLRGLRDLGSNLTATPRPRSHAHLVELGVYRRVRHPIYAGILAGSLGWALVAGSLVTALLAAVLAVWFDLKARREEVWLAERYPEYPAYAARTRRFVPRVY